jgi:hypothetical protein
VTLQDFIDELSEPDIGTLFIHTHGRSTGLGIEYYSQTGEGRRARDSVYFYYTHREEDPIDSAYIYRGESPAGPSISINDRGVRHYNDSLYKSIVFVQSCNSAGLNDDWDALAALGYTGHTCGSWATTRFFRRIGGLIDRGPDSTNLRREVGDAAHGLYYACGIDTAWLVLRRNATNDYVVISPIVIDHYPKHLGTFVPGQDGYVLFDCEMDLEHILAKNVIGMTGVNAELSNVEWQNPYAIKFTLPQAIPGEQEYCLLGFQVDPDSARSRHNMSKLDGNSNPDRRNGENENTKYLDFA